jgi:hypothetical protein
MTKIKGKTFKGQGNAGKYIEQQKPFLKDFVPEIMSMFSGTLNFHLEQRITIKKYDVVTPLIKWGNGQEEEFYLLKAKVEFPDGSYPSEIFSCLIYNSTLSAYRGRPTTQNVELVMRKIDGIKPTECIISFDQPCQKKGEVLIIG